MNLNSYKKELISKLSSIMPKHEAISELDFILSEHFNLNKKDLLFSPEKIIPVKPELESIVNTRVSLQKPLQYIINKASFMGDIYYVDERVLIPRPETEILVNEVLKYANDKTKILEIGTGSGCIAISLAKLLKNKNITTSDISEKALEVAMKNAKTLCPSIKINFVHSNLFENIKDKFDIIVSNPPYIDKKLKVGMQKEVHDFEPKNALFADDSGLYFYKQIIQQAPKYLKNKGILAFEAGINQSKEIEKIMIENGFSKIIIIPDLSSIDRVVLGSYNFIRKG